MSKFKIKVELSQGFDEQAIASAWLDEQDAGEIQVEESVYEISSMEMVGDPVFDTTGCGGHGTITFEVEVVANKTEGKFVSNSELADELMGTMQTDFSDEGTGEWAVEVSEA